MGIINTTSVSALMTTPAQAPKALASNTAFTIGTPTFDNYSGYNGSNAYIIPVTGIYNISLIGDMGAASSVGANQMIQCQAFKNGTSVINAVLRSQATAANGDWGVTGSGLVSCTVGDSITTNMNTNFGTPGTTASVIMSINKVN